MGRGRELKLLQSGLIANVKLHFFFLTGDDMTLPGNRGTTRRLESLLK